MQKIVLPRHVDAPQRFLFWTIDQLVPFSVFVGVGIMTRQLMTSVVIGGFVVWQFNRYRESKADGYVRHLMWWYGLVKPAEKRKYLGGWFGPKRPIRSVLNPFARKVLPA